jgi:hypothetical protein
VVLEEYLAAAGLNVRRLDGTVTNKKTIKHATTSSTGTRTSETEYWEPTARRACSS